MSATIHYLPTAHITPLPRRANVGRLPAGVARFPSHRRKREALRQASAAPMSDYELQLRRLAELMVDRGEKAGKPCTFDFALRTLREVAAKTRAPEPRGAA